MDSHGNLCALCEKILERMNKGMRPVGLHDASNELLNTHNFHTITA